MRRFVVLPVLLAIAVLAAGCGDKGETPPPDSSSSAASVIPSSEPIEAGTYLYNSYGVHATLKPDGDAWALSVTNKTGSALSKPGIYALDASDGHQIDGVVVDSKPLNNNQTGDFTVTGLPGESKNIGLMILEFGEENWGAFSAG